MKSYKTGKEVREVPGKAFGAAACCMNHPYLCGGKLALGGIAGTVASNEPPRMWLILNAHKMKNMADSMQQVGTGSCYV